MLLLDRTVTGGLVFLVVITPLVFGSVHPLAYGLMEVGIFCMVLLWAVRLCGSGTDNSVLAPGARSEDSGRMHRGVLYLSLPLMLLIAFIALQLVPLPPTVLKFVSPATYEVYTHSLPGWPDTAPFAGLQKTETDALPANAGSRSPRAERRQTSESGEWMPISLAPKLTQIDLLKLTAYTALLFVVLCYPFAKGANPPSTAGGSRPYPDRMPTAAGRWLNAVLYAILLNGFVVASLGFLNLFTWNGKVLWLLEPFDGGSAGATRAASPFINPDHFAGYLALVFPLMITGAAYRTFLTPKNHEAAFRILCGFGAFLMLCSLLLSLSRGGWIAAILGITLLFSLSGGRGSRESNIRHSSRRLRRAGFTVAGLAVVLAILYVGPRARQDLDLRLSQTLEQTTDLAGRIAIWRDGIQMVPDFPILGVGLGAWPELFPRYQSSQPSLFWREAHNDYLEFLSETGIVGFLLLAWFFFVCLRHVFRGMRSFDQQTSPVVAAVLAGVSALAVTEFFDFHLQIPATAFLFTLMLAAALRLSLAGCGASGIRIPPTGQRALAVVMSVAAAALIVGVFRQDAIPYPHNLTSTTPTTIARAIDRIKSYPANSDGHLALFSLLRPGDGPITGDRRSEANRPVAALRAALWLDPNNTRARDLLAALLIRQGYVVQGLNQVTRSVLDAPSLSAHFYLAPEFLTRLSSAERQAIDDGFKKAAATGTPGALDQLGIFYARTDRLAQSAALYEGAASDSGVADLKLSYLLEAGSARAAAGDLEKAEELYRRAVDLRPQGSKPYEELIRRVYMPQKKLDKASQTVREATAGGADGFSLYLLVAKLAHKVGDASASEDALAAALELLARDRRTNTFDRYIALSQTAWNVRNQKLARSALDEAARVVRPSFRTFSRLGHLYARQKNLDRAAFYYTKATRADPQSAAAFYRLAVAEERNFRFEAAKRAYTTALRLDPDNAGIQAGYAKFEQRLADNRNAE